jgi:hypothetical protein
MDAATTPAEAHVAASCHCGRHAGSELALVWPCTAISTDRVCGPSGYRDRHTSDISAAAPRLYRLPACTPSELPVIPVDERAAEVRAINLD